MVWWLAHRVFTAVIGVRIPSGAVKFDIDNQYVKVPRGGNRLFLFPADVLNARAVLSSTCSLYTSDLMSCCQLKG